MAGLGVVLGHLLPNIIVLVEFGLLEVPLRDGDYSILLDLNISICI